MKKQPKHDQRPPIPAKVWAITLRRGREVVRSISKCTGDVTLAEIAMAGYLQGQEDMALALRKFPQHVLCNQDEDWSLP